MRTATGRTLITATFVACFTTVPAFTQQDFVLRSATTPLCGQQQLEDWRFVRDRTFGVAGRDPVGHKIGPNVAYRMGVGMNWYPLDIYKQTLCGKLHHFNFFDGWGDEADWNTYFIPNASHAYVLEDARPVADPDHIYDCDGNGDCLEGEITRREVLRQPVVSQGAR
jgi:hypothetical protein